MLKTIKTAGKKFLCLLLEAQVRRLRSGHDFKLIAVAGSIGKTSTKRAIVTILEQEHAVRSQAGNYNDRLTVPLVIFGHTEPSIFDVLSWLRILIDNERQLRQPYPYEFVVVELGTDGPGQISQFAYLEPDVTVLTAVADEHMEYFKTLDAVAEEELTVSQFSRKLVCNIDLIDKKYLVDRQYIGYGADESAAYRITNSDYQGTKGQILTISRDGQSVKSTTTLLGVQGASIVAGAVAAITESGLDFARTMQQSSAITAVAGRLQLLAGLQNSLLIDDTYNASPTAVKAALDVLYATANLQRIAVLGDMNELGETSAAAHQAVGRYCDPERLDLVLTIGPMSKIHLAPPAQAAGCNVKTFDSPYAVGRYLLEIMKPEAAILFKGSQNRVFAEEAVKSVLANPTDAQKLVRQSTDWINIKRRQFDDA